MFNYEKLEVWQKAVALADLIYTTTRTFPDDERYGLTNQMRRSAVSVSSNLAEGSSGNSRQDFARFVKIAAGSAFELVSQAVIAGRQGYLNEADYQTNYQRCEKLGPMSSGLRKSLLDSPV